MRMFARSTFRKLEIVAELFEMKAAERTRATIARSRARACGKRKAEKMFSATATRADNQAKRLERLVVHYANQYAKEVIGEHCHEEGRPNQT